MKGEHDRVRWEEQPESIFLPTAGCVIIRHPRATAAAKTRRRVPG